MSHCLKICHELQSTNLDPIKFEFLAVYLWFKGTMVETSMKQLIFAYASILVVLDEHFEIEWQDGIKFQCQKITYLLQKLLVRRSIIYRAPTSVLHINVNTSVIFFFLHDKNNIWQTRRGYCQFLIHYSPTNRRWQYQNGCTQSLVQLFIMKRNSSEQFV